MSQHVLGRNTAATMLCVLLSCGAICHGDAASPGRLPGASGGDAKSTQLTPVKLQREMFHFADRYLELVAQATEDGMRQAPTIPVRAALLSTRVAYASSAISIVTSPQPLEALRDLVVMVTLQRMVWESGADGTIPRDRTQAIAAVLRELESEIVALAATAIPADGLRALLALTAQWRRDHPSQHYVAFVRFHHLGRSPLADETEAALGGGGLLAPIEDVAREAHDARLLAERAMFMANRAPLVLGWQAELVYQRVAGSPEVSAMIIELDRYRTTIDGIGKTIDGLPARVGGEIGAQLTQTVTLVERERRLALRELESMIRRERTAIARALDEGGKAHGPIVEQLSRAATSLRDTMATLERIDKASNGREPVDLRRLQALADSTATGGERLLYLVEGIERLLVSGESRQSVAAIDRALVEHERRLFLYAAGLVILFGIVLFLALRWGLRRRGDQQRDRG